MRLHVDVDHHSGPCSDADHMDDVGLPAMTGCCYWGNCISGLSASLLDL